MILPSHPLPPGWVTQYATDTGRPFYVNSATGSSQWEIPPPPPVPPASPSPPGWITQYATDSGHPFYVNSATGLSQWEIPVPPPGPLAPSPNPLPPGWVTQYAAGSGCPFYVYSGTNFSQWEHPAPLPMPPVSQQSIRASAISSLPAAPAPFTQAHQLFVPQTNNNSTYVPSPACPTPYNQPAPAYSQPAPVAADQHARFGGTSLTDHAQNYQFPPGHGSSSQAYIRTPDPASYRQLDASFDAQPTNSLPAVSSSYGQGIPAHSQHKRPLPHNNAFQQQVAPLRPILCESTRQVSALQGYRQQQQNEPALRIKTNGKLVSL
jgi:hypothetical protein